MIKTELFKQSLFTNYVKKEPTFAFATVAEVSTTKGVRLRFDGESAATQKFYPVSKVMIRPSSGSFYNNLAVGDRVKVLKDSGTYVVEYKLGLPTSSESSSGGETEEGGETDNPPVDTTITFTINSHSIGSLQSTYSHTYTADVGMKLNEWLQSEYNTDGWRNESGTIYNFSNSKLISSTLNQTTTLSYSYFKVITDGMVMN